MASADAQGVGVGARLLSACAGSVAVGLIVTPLDVAKVRMQASQASQTSRASPASAFQESHTFVCGNGITDHAFDRRIAPWPRLFKFSENGKPGKPGMLRTLRSIHVETGFAGLYAGLPVTMVIAVPANVLYFATYESMRDWILQQRPSAGVLAPLVAGGLGRAVAVTACAPLEVVRTRMQAGSIRNGRPSIGAALKDILTNEGPRALFRGLESTLWRDVPFSAFYWLGVEAVRDSLLRRGFLLDSAYRSPLVALIASSTAGAAAAFVTTPFDVVKTRRQVQAHGGGTRQPSLWRDMLSLSRSEGVGSLFTGSTPRVVRVAPACSIMLGTYELTKQMLARP